MRSALKITSILAATVALFNSCKNELNILAPYKEAVSVYGILDPQDSIQMIRINKIFLGKGDAYEMAQVSDSINYPAGALTVTLERFVNNVQAPTTKGSSKTKIVLRDSLIQLATVPNPIFNSNQRIYVTGDRLYNSGTYKMTIKNNNSGNVFTAQTVMVDTVRMTLGYDPIRWPFYPFPPGPSYFYLDYSLPTLSRSIRFVSVPLAREYSCTIRFHYRDKKLDNSVDSHYVDLTLPSARAKELSGGELLTLNFTSGDLYSTIEGGINKIGTPSNLKGRQATHIDFIVTAGAQEFSDFLQISAPSTSVAQDKPAYTNIDGGFGIFSSKSHRIFPKAIKSDWIDYMASNKPICSLYFFNSAGVINFSCN